MTPQHTATHRARPIVAGLALVFCLAGPGPLAQAAGPGVHGYVWALNDKGLVTGTVPGAQIVFKDQGGKVAAKATADANGYYKADLAPGTYYYKVTAEGYKNEDHGRAVTLKKSEGYWPFNFSLVKGKNDPDRKPPVIPQVATGRLKGRVVEKTAKAFVAIVGARITLHQTDGKAKLIQVVSGGGSGENAGHYEVVLPAGTYRASVSAAGFDRLVDPDPIKIVAGKEETRDFILKRRKPAPPTEQGIKGTVTAYDAKGRAAPLPKVTLTIQRLFGGAMPEVTFSPDADSKFSRDLGPGAYRVVAKAPGYQAVSSGPRYVVRGKYTIADLALRLAAPAKEPTFVATVYERLPDGAGRQPLPGATVVLRKQGQPVNGSPRGVTGADGKVMLKPASAGKYDVVAYKPGYRSAGQTLTITPAGPNGAELTLEKGKPPTEDTATLTVEVVERGRDGKAVPAPRARVVVRKAGEEVARGTADVSGRFIAAKLDRADYQVEASKEGRRGSAAASLARGDATARVVLRGEGPPDGKATLTVKVLERGRKAVPVAGAAIAVMDRGKRVAQGKSDSSGRYSVTLARQATYPYSVSVTKEGYRPASAEASTAEGDATVKVYLLRGQPGEPRMLTVEVLDSGSARAVPGASVRVLKDTRVVASGTANASGVYSTAVEPGPYNVVVTKAGYSTGSAAVNVTSAKAAVQVFLRPGLKLTVEVMEERVAGKPQPAAGAQVVVRRGEAVAARGLTDSAGHYAVPLSPSTYQVEVTKSGYKPATASAELTQRDATVKVRLTRGDERTLTVYVEGRGPDGKLVGVATRVVVRRGEQTVAQGSTSASGSYSVHLPAGTYSVTATRGARLASAQADLTSGDKEVRLTLPGEPVPQATLTVQVQQRDADGRLGPAAKAQVVVRRGGVIAAQGTTGASGRYVTRLRPGTYSVTATRGGQRASDVADLTHGDKEVHLILDGGQRPATLTVQVQQRDADGRLGPAAGAQVVVRRGGVIAAQGTTSARGRYVTRLRPAAYSVTATRGSRQASAETDLSSGDKEVDLTLAGSPAAQATLTVQVQDGRGRAVSAAQVTVTRGMQVAASGTSDASGVFSARLPRASYQVRASRGPLRGSAAADLTAGDAKVRVVLGGTGPDGQTATLTVIVVTPGRSTAQAPVPASGAQVVIRRGGQVVAQGTTDTSGRYVAAGLQRTRHGVTASKGSQQGSASADLTQGDQTVRVFLKGEPGPGPVGQATLTVQVQTQDPDRAAAGLAGALVVIRSGGKEVKRGTTDGSGRFSAALPRANYQVTVSRSGYQPAERSANLTAGDAGISVFLYPAKRRTR
jgi:hypothetical protein